MIKQDNNNSMINRLKGSVTELDSDLIKHKYKKPSDADDITKKLKKLVINNTADVIKAKGYVKGENPLIDELLDAGNRREYALKYVNVLYKHEKCKYTELDLSVSDNYLDDSESITSYHTRIAKRVIRYLQKKEFDISDTRIVEAYTRTSIETGGCVAVVIINNSNYFKIGAVNGAFSTNDRYTDSKVDIFTISADYIQAGAIIQAKYMQQTQDTLEDLKNNPMSLYKGILNDSIIAEKTAEYQHEAKELKYDIYKNINGFLIRLILDSTVAKAKNIAKRLKHNLVRYTQLDNDLSKIIEAYAEHYCNVSEAYYFKAVEIYIELLGLNNLDENVTLDKNINSYAGVTEQKRNINKKAKGFMAINAFKNQPDLQLEGNSHKDTPPDANTGVRFVEYDSDTKRVLYYKLNAGYALSQCFLPHIDDWTFKVRKLGLHNAVGIYYPQRNILAVEMITTFMHEYGHMLDYKLTDRQLSKTVDFRPIIEAYKQSIRNENNKLKSYGNDSLMLDQKSYEYYTKDSEIFARCFEAYLYYRGVRTPLLKDLDALGAGIEYDATKEIIPLINDYFNNIINLDIILYNETNKLSQGLFDITCQSISDIVDIDPALEPNKIKAYLPKGDKEQRELLLYTHILQEVKQMDSLRDTFNIQRFSLVATSHTDMSSHNYSDMIAEDRLINIVPDVCNTTSDVITNMYNNALTNITPIEELTRQIVKYILSF